MKKILLHFPFLIAFYIMNVFTPFNGDDYGYAHIIGTENLTAIQSFGDVIESQINHYFLCNGRFIPHFLEQSFMGIIGKDIFNILNTIVFFLLARLLYRINFNGYPLNNNRQIIIYSGIYFSILFFFAYPGQTELWMDGSFNYMWPMVLSLYILKLFTTNRSYSIPIYGIFFIISIIAGWTHEGIVIAIDTVLILCLFIHHHYRNIKNYVIVAGYTLGTLLVSFSPGTLHRLSTNEAPMHGDILWLILSKLLNSFTALSHVYIFWISAILMIMLIFKKKYHVFNGNNTLWLLLWMSNLGFIVLLGFGDERVCYGLSVFSFILLIQLYKEKILQGRIKKQIALIAVFLIISGNIYAIHCTYKYSQYYKSYTTAIHENKDENIVIGLSPYKDNSRFIFIDNIYNDLRPRNSFYNKQSIKVLDTDCYAIYNSAEHPYYIKDTTNAYQIYHNKEKSSFYLILDEVLSNDRIKITEYHPSNMDSLKWHQRMIRNILKSHDQGKSLIKYNSSQKDNKQFIFFRLPSNCNVLEVQIKDRIISFQI